MTADRRAEAVMGLKEVIAIQGYAIVPLLMQPQPDTEHTKDAWQAAGEVPLEDKGYEHVYLGWLQPFLRDPFNPQHESRFGRFLIYDPKVMKVEIAYPINGADISDWADRLREKGMSVVDTTNSEGRVVGISRRVAAPVAAGIY